MDWFALRFVKVECAFITIYSVDFNLLAFYLRAHMYDVMATSVKLRDFITAMTISGQNSWDCGVPPQARS